MFAFFGSMFKKVDQSYMNNFKSWAESVGPVEQKLSDKVVVDASTDQNNQADTKPKSSKDEVKPKKSIVQSGNNENALGYPSDCPHDQGR